MQKENSPNEVQKWYPRGTNFFGVQTVQMRYCTPKWGTVGNSGPKEPLFKFDETSKYCFSLPTIELQFSINQRVDKLSV